MIKNTYREGQKTHYSAVAIVNLSAISSKFEQNFPPIRFRLASCLPMYSSVKDSLTLVIKPLAPFGAKEKA